MTEQKGDEFVREAVGMNLLFIVDQSNSNLQQQQFRFNSKTLQK